MTVAHIPGVGAGFLTLLPLVVVLNKDLPNNGNMPITNPATTNASRIEKVTTTVLHE